MTTYKLQPSTNTATRTCNNRIFRLAKNSVSVVSCQLSAQAVSVVSGARTRAFTLLELLLVVGIMALLSAAGVGSYRGFVKNVEIQSAAKMLASDLRSVRSKSMIGEGGVKWGVRVVNVSGGNDYYELFSTATDYPAGQTVATTTLPNGVNFSDPGDGLSKDIIFSRISGTTTPETVTFVSEDAVKTLVVSSIGTIN